MTLPAVDGALKPVAHRLARWFMSNSEAEIRAKLQHLYVEHRDLNVIIDRLSLDPMVDQLLITRLKKKKLQLKDMISRLEDELIPDDIA
jgi:hypothetical protein